MNRVVNMILRQLTRQLISKGINGASASKPGQSPAPTDKATAKRLQQSVRMMRRLTRF